MVSVEIHAFARPARDRRSRGNVFGRSIQRLDKQRADVGRQVVVQHERAVLGVSNPYGNSKAEAARAPARAQRALPACTKPATSSSTGASQRSGRAKALASVT